MNHLLSGEVKLKFKGIQQNSDVSEILSINVFKSLILEDIEGLEGLYDRVTDTSLRHSWSKMGKLALFELNQIG